MVYYLERFVSFLIRFLIRKIGKSKFRKLTDGLKGMVDAAWKELRTRRLDYSATVTT